MDIESFSGAATVAAACTIVFVVVMKSWQVVSRTINSGPLFTDGIVREAAQRFRDEFERLSNTQAIYLSAGLVFIMLFMAAHALDAERLYAGYPDWQLHIFATVLTIGLLLVLASLVRIVIDRHHVRLLRDANIVVGHQLQHVAAGFGQVFHDVETSAGVIDHVVVGQSGAYAVSVFARRPVSNGHVEIDNNELIFRPSGDSDSILANGKCIAALERAFRRLLDHRVRVRSVIAVPGWQIDNQSNDEHLLVNADSLPMMRGWKDQADYLMNEDVEALHKMLTDLTKA